MTTLPTKIALTGCLITAAVWDLKTRRVPHVLTWGLLLAATALAVAHPGGLCSTLGMDGNPSWPSEQGGLSLAPDGWALPLLLVGLLLIERMPPAWQLPTLVFLVSGTRLASLSLHGHPATRFTAFWWGVVYALWWLHVVGGADARMFMALVALFPRPELVAALSGGLLSVSVAWLILTRRQGALASLLEVKGKMLCGQFPSRDELEEHGRPTTPGLTLGALVFLWLMS